MCDQHEFVFEFDKAYNHQLIEKFELSPEHQLTPTLAPPRKGVYSLYHQGMLVYAGKALNTTLARRLAEHYRKIEGRQNIDVATVSCRFLTIDGDWFVRAAGGRPDPALLAGVAEQRLRQPRAWKGPARHSDEPVGQTLSAQGCLGFQNNRSVVETGLQLRSSSVPVSNR